MESRKTTSKSEIDTFKAEKDLSFSSALEESSESLLAHLQSKNYQDASHIISAMVEAKDKKILSSAGQLTRALHEVILNFNSDEQEQSNSIDESSSVVDGFEIKDASDRLKYVLSLTRKAADKTMDMVEQSAPIADKLGREAKEIRSEWIKLKRREITKPEFKALYLRIDEFLENMCTGSEKINNNMQTILVEQGFQDLTGQVLTKVISLVKDVENELVSLVKMAGHLETVTGIEPSKNTVSKLTKKKSSNGDGPQIHAESRDDVMNGQDDVDDLLSSLGF